MNICPECKGKKVMWYEWSNGVAVKCETCKGTGMKGKAYANKKPKNERPIGDFYSTPKSLIWVAEDIIKEEFPDQPILEPCAGQNAITNELWKLDYYTTSNDLHRDNDNVMFAYDYLKNPILNEHKYIITNPPFSSWDEFVNRSKSHCNKFMFIGRLNYFGTAGRSKSGIWNNLKGVYPFNRYVDYQTPYREDGLFHVGAMATAWFLWDMSYTEKPTIEILDVQEYAKLGQFKKREK